MELRVGGTMVQYEIHYLRQNGTTIFIGKARCLNDLDARLMADEMVIPEASSVEIWRDGKCVATCDAKKLPQTSSKERLGVE